MTVFLLLSVVGSIVLTILLNVALRSPGASRRIDGGVRRLTERSSGWEASGGRSQVRVHFPWKAMLIGSLLLTLVLNLALRLF